MQRSVDVAIVGGGLAGNLLARQLQKTLPNVSVAMFERDVERGWKVGESTVEIAASYLTRRLNLATYLYEQMLPKNGLRFFFDTEAKDADLHTMSEIGLAQLPPYPSFQLDRARFERDLLVMNQKDGVDVHVGARVKDLVLADDGAHTFKVVEESGTTEWKARWLVDAAGRASIIAKQEGLRFPEKTHKIAAAWGRFEGVRDMDDWGVPEWHARVRNTARFLSTNHLCYPGYWIWFIPLRGVMSVGVVADAKIWDKSYMQRDGFLAHLRSHRSSAQLLEGSSMLDMGAFTQLAFRTKKFFDSRRWACVGEAGAFTDPFYSPGSDYIALENDLVTDLITRELAGEDIGERTKMYDAFMHFRFDVTMSLYDDQYQTFGSYELYRAKLFFDCACYYNLWFDSYMKDEHLDLKAVDGILRRAAPVHTAMANFSRAFRSTADWLRRNGAYYRKNLGHGLHDGLDAFGPILNVGEKRRRPEIDARTEEIFNRTMDLLTQIREGESARWPAQPIWSFADQEVDLFEAPKNAPGAPAASAVP